MDRWDVVQVACDSPARPQANLSVGRIKIGSAPSSGNRGSTGRSVGRLLCPRWGRRRQVSGDRPEDRVAFVVAVEGSKVRYGLQVRVVRSEVPLVGVARTAPVSTEEDLSAYFAIEKFENARSALAR